MTRHEAPLNNGFEDVTTSNIHETKVTPASISQMEDFDLIGLENWIHEQLSMRPDDETREKLLSFINLIEKRRTELAG